MKTQRTILVLSGLVLYTTGVAQEVTYRQPIARRNTQNVTRADWSQSRGNTNVTPRNYERYYYSRGNPYAYTAPVVPMNTGPVILGPVQPYTNVEYARLIMSTLDAGAVRPAAARTTGRSIVVEKENDELFGEYDRVETRVADVLDRGVIVVETREQVRLRGVRMLSESDPDEVTRYYAREAIRTIRDLTLDQTVYIDFEDPLRDPDGTLLGTVYLSDGTELNRLILDHGLGQLEPKDFADDRDITELVLSEATARQAKIGLFSR